MLKIRLRRVGKKGQPSYRIVVADSRAQRDGAFVDLVGFYNPLVDPPEVRLDKSKISRWLANGAQPSDPVRHMLVKSGLLESAKSDEATS
jgi:small subunit ribosomal protein S16